MEIVYKNADQKHTEHPRGNCQPETLERLPTSKQVGDAENQQSWGSLSQFVRMSVHVCVCGHVGRGQKP